MDWNIELEQGPAFSDANVTNNHPILHPLEGLFWPTSTRDSITTFDSELLKSKETCSKRLSPNFLADVQVSAMGNSLGHQRSVKRAIAGVQAVAAEENELPQPARSSALAKVGTANALNQACLINRSWLQRFD